MDAQHGAELDAFRRYLYASWCEACRTNPPKGRGATRAAHAITQERIVLQHLCDPKRNVVFGLGESRDQVGFIPDTRGLWVRNLYLASIPGTTLTRDSRIRFFHQKRTIYQRMRSFFETQARKQSIDPTEFSADDQAFLRRIGWNGKRLKHRGRILIGCDDATSWIGITTLDDAKYPEPETAANRFVSDLIVRPMPAAPMAGWPRLAPTLPSNTDWRSVGADLLASFREDGSIPHSATSLSLGAASGADIPRLVQDSVSRTADSNECFIATILTLEDVESSLREAFRGLGLGPGAVVHVLDREQMTAGLARFPWIWSKYCGQEHSFSVLRCTPESLQQLGSPTLLTDLPFVHREELDQIDSTASTTLLVGRPGSGKSTALRHLARKLDATAIITDRDDGPTADVRDEELIAGMIKDIAGRGLAVAVILDDIDQPSRSSLFRNLVARKLPATLLATASERVATDDRVTIVNLNVVPRRFRLGLLQAVADRQGILYDAGTLEDADDDAVFSRATPREIIAHVERHGRLDGCVGVADLTHPYWRARFDALSSEARDVLVGVAILRRLGLRRVCVREMELVFAALHDPTRFEEVLDALAQRDWVSGTNVGFIWTPFLSNDFFMSNHASFSEELSARARSVLRVALTKFDDERRYLIVRSNPLLELMLSNRPEELELLRQTTAELAAVKASEIRD